MYDFAGGILDKVINKIGNLLAAGPAVVNGQTVTLNVTRSAAPASNYASPPVVAIPNNLNAGNKPYPVQESVTVVPLLQPQSTPVQYPPNPVSVNYPNGPGPQFPQNFGNFVKSLKSKFSIKSDK